MSCNCSKNPNYENGCHNPKNPGYENGCHNPKTPKRCSNIPPIDTDICCNGQIPPKFNIAKAQTICCYVDRIFDSKCITGSAIFDSITTDTISYSTSFVTNNKNPMCCVPCSLNSTSNFYPSDSIMSDLISLSPVTPLTLSNVLVNGVPVTNLVQNIDGSYTASIGDTLDNDSEVCDNPNSGVRSTLLVTNVGNPWNYMATHTIYGLLNTSGQCCDFKLNFENLKAKSAQTQSSTFMVQNICIPPHSESITFSFNGSVSLLNPIITFDTISNLPIVSGNIVINPIMSIEILQKTKACIQAIL